MIALERECPADYITAMSRQAPRLAIALGVGLLLASACYLYAVRGSAILLDLSGMIGGLWCF